MASKPHAMDDMNGVIDQVTRDEGGKVSVDVAQVKEVFRRARDLARRDETAEQTLLRYFSKKRSKERTEGAGGVAKKKLGGK